ncbi:MAG: hypothetical protein U5L45_08330 [Saprospiraceae bacterium]|nr:hypothetical protein [Saprospiraceae bacterium]
MFAKTETWFIFRALPRKRTRFLYLRAKRAIDLSYKSKTTKIVFTPSVFLEKMNCG